MKKLKIVGFVMVGLVTLVALAWAVENFRGHRAWAGYQAELKAAGEPLAFSELMPAPVPDDQNFAKTPLLAPLHEYAIDPESEHAVWRDTNAVGRAQRVFEWWVDRREIRSLWRVGEFVDWGEWQRELRGQTNTPYAQLRALQSAPQGRPEEDVMFLLEQNRAELEEIREALKRPHSVFGVHYEESVNALLPELAVIRRFAQVFRARALAGLALGRVDEAFADADAVFGLAETLKTEPLLISQLVRMAALELAVQPAWEGMARHQWNAVQVERFQERFAAVNLVADLRRAMQGERIGGVLAIDYMRVNQWDFLADESAPYLRYMPAGWFAQNKVTVARGIEELVLPVLDVKQGRIDLGLAEKSGREIDERLKPSRPHNVLAGMILPSLGPACRKVVRGVATLDLGEVACALERHRLAHGSYPETLAALVPGGVPMLPVDAVTWEPLRYRRMGEGGFVLYGVGLNRVDDGGEPGKDKRGGPQPDKPEGDWVWRVGGAR